MPDIQPPDNRIDDDAMDWFLRAVEGAMTPEERRNLDDWLLSDPRHRAAFDDIRQTWDMAGDMAAAFAQPFQTDVTPLRPKRPARRAAMAAGLLAACLALFATAEALDLPIRLQADYRTPTGEQARVDLPDGSVAYLNTDSAIAVDFSGPTRQVTLLKGEALFEVAKNPARPFDVEALDGQARAVGTAYAVRDDGQAAQVTVTEGVVQVTTGGEQLTLSAGDRVSYRSGKAPGAIEHTANGNIPSLAWRRGLIVLNGQSFKQALSEIDRYRPGRIVLLADAARLTPVTARLSLSSLDGGLRALAATQGLTVTRVTDYLMVIR